MGGPPVCVSEQLHGRLAKSLMGDLQSFGMAIICNAACFYSRAYANVFVEKTAENMFSTVCLLSKGVFRRRKAA